MERKGDAFFENVPNVRIWNFAVCDWVGLSRKSAHSCRIPYMWYVFQFSAVIVENYLCFHDSFLHFVYLLMSLSISMHYLFYFWKYFLRSDQIFNNKTHHSYLITIRINIFYLYSNCDFNPIFLNNFESVYNINFLK